jgi:hypothetical protein
MKAITAPRTFRPAFARVPTALPSVPACQEPRQEPIRVRLVGGVPPEANRVPTGSTGSLAAIFVG